MRLIKRFKKPVLFLLPILFLCLIPMTGHSNSPPLMMVGNTAIPVNNNDIELESEIIKIHYNPSNSEDENKHEIEVIFNFHNTGRDTEIDIGFPNVSMSGENAALGDFKAYSYPDMKQFDTLLKDGYSITEQVKYGFNSYYTWKMKFKENEKRSLYVKYDLVSPRMVDYILVTGAFWKGVVGKIDIYADFPRKASYPEIEAYPYDYYYNGTGIEWHFTDLEPDFNLSISLKEVPDYFKLTDEYFKPGKIEGDISYKWDKGFYEISTSELVMKTGNPKKDLMPLWEVENIEVVRRIVNQSLDAAAIVKNHILARNGYVFTDNKWKDIFTETTWYKLDRGYGEHKLNKIEKLNIRYIEQFEKMINPKDSEGELRKKLKEFTELYNGDKQYYNSWLNYQALIDTKNDINKIRKNNSAEILPDVYDTYRIVNNGTRILNSIEEQDVPDRICYADEKRMLLSNPGCMTIYRDGLYFKLLELCNMPESHYNVSPNGEFAVTGASDDAYRSSATDESLGFIPQDIYLVLIEDGRNFVIDRGDFNDFLFKWSPSGNMLAYMSKKERKTLKVFDSKLGEFKSYKNPAIINENNIKNLIMSDDGIILIQTGEEIYFFNTKDGKSGKTTLNGTLLGFTKGKDKAYYYNGSKIFTYGISDSSTELFKDLGIGIFAHKDSGNNIFQLFCGYNTTYAYNLGNETIYKYINDITGSGNVYPYSSYRGVSLPSPSCKYLFVSGYTTDERIAIITGDVNTKKEDMFLKWSSVWLDDDSLAVLEYPKIFKYNPFNGAKEELKYIIAQNSEAGSNQNDREDSAQDLSKSSIEDKNKSEWNYLLILIPVIVVILGSGIFILLQRKGNAGRNKKAGAEINKKGQVL